jgi:hypothetical protein
MKLSSNVAIVAPTKEMIMIAMDGCWIETVGLSSSRHSRSASHGRSGQPLLVVGFAFQRRHPTL